MTRLKRVAAAVLVVSASAGANAAVLERAAAPVRAFTPSGYRAVPVGSSLDAGTRIVVSLGSGEAVVGFEGGCRITLKPGQVFTVPERNPCEPAALPQSEAFGGSMAPAAVAGGLAAAGLAAGLFIGLGSKQSQNPGYISR